jgi:glutamate-ammonia-ligase adenylyltransferase
MSATKKQIFPDKFISDLVQISEGFLSNDQFEKLIFLFEAETKKHFWTNSSEANLHRILSALYDKVSFLLDCLKYPHHVETVVTIASNSNFLTDIIVRNPEYLYQVFNPDYLKTEIKEERISKKIYEGTAKYKTFNGRVNFLKLFKRRLILKIGLNDLLNLKSLSSITADLSILAKCINAALFELCFNEILLKYEIVSAKTRYCLASLGKLGGGELNYSSDVDFILFYDKNSKIGKNKKKEYFELLSETAQLFTQVSCDITEKGFVYRVDFRLRPDGKNSPICRTIADYTKYYETRGEDWERQMLIKLDFVCGNKNLYERFTKYLTSYIYPTSFSMSPIEQISKIKSNIEKRLEDEGNIKLIPGGIRDIEFSVQALQLMNGGKFKDLRTGNTLNAIDKLAELNLLTKKESKVYNESYVFYRRVEHYLQLMNDRQTHSIPAEGEMLEKLSSYLGFKSPKDFNKRIEVYRNNVKSIFDSIINSENHTQSFEKNKYADIKFADEARAHKNLNFLRTGIGLLQQKMFDQKSISLFSEIEPELFNYLNSALDPDKVLENFSKIISRIQFPSIWYREFKESKFFSDFLTICEYSQRAVDMVTANESLQELILSKKIFTKNIDYSEISFNQLVFILSVQSTLKLINHKIFSIHLSNGISQHIKKIAEENTEAGVFFIAGLGSFGTQEMNFASDIDLVVVVDELSNPEIINREFQNYLNKLQEVLKPFQVDFRLRPEGKSSLLVWDINNYKEYLKKRARIWEFQAFLKLKFILGNENLFNQFQKALVNYLPGDNKIIKTELLAMSKKLQQQNFSGIGSSFNLKTSRGGIQSIDFIVHYILMCKKVLYFECMGSTIEDKISQIIKFSSDFDDLESLEVCVKSFREMEIAIQNIFGKNSCSLPVDDNQKGMLAKHLGFNSASELSNEIIQQRKTVSSLFDKYLGK